MNKIINGNITIYMQDLRLKRDIGYPYVIKPGTTLNDILDINKDGIGELAVKGPNVIFEYYENKEATEKVLKDGWFQKTLIL